MDRYTTSGVLFALLFTCACQASSEAGEAVEAVGSASRITSDPGRELYPSLSRDGSTLAYEALTSVGNRDIHLLEGDAPPRNLTADFGGQDVQPAISPDGSRIAFSSAREGGGLFVMSVSGGPATRLVEGSAFTPLQ